MIIYVCTWYVHNICSAWFLDISISTCSLCNSDTAVGCQPEIDSVWEIEWNFINVSTVAVQKCPGLSDSTGMECYVPDYLH